jgi:putative two-component system response regulator
MALVLVVHDLESDRELLRQVLDRKGHDALVVADGEEALVRARERRPALILSAMLLPRRDGFDLCRTLQRDPTLRHIPFVFVTGTYDEPIAHALATDVGAVRVLVGPYDAEDLDRLIDDVLAGPGPSEPTGRFRQMDEETFHRRHAEVAASKVEQKVAELQAANARLLETEARTERSLLAMVDAVSKIVEYRDPYTIGHERHVGLLAAAIAKEMGLDSQIVQGIRVGGFLHDVGKVAVPAELLVKPTRLTEVEFRIIKTHPIVGHDILSRIEFPWPVADMALQHHERLDGSGYPQGLNGDEIILEAKILAVADVVEAMGSHRPYRPAIGADRALEEIEKGAGQIYDARAVAACVRLFREGRFQFLPDAIPLATGGPAGVDRRRDASHGPL